MKSKKIKKLTVNKETIARLNDEELNSVKGEGSYTGECCKSAAPVFCEIEMQ